MTPAVGYTETKDSGVPWILSIPAHWKVCRLKDLFSFGKGLPITKADLIEHGIPVISYGQIHSKTNTGTHLSKELCRYVSEDYLRTNPTCVLQEGDIVLADTSEDLEGLGNAALNDMPSTVFAGYHTIILRPIVKGFSKYCAYLFRSGSWRSQLRASASGIKVFSVTQRMLRSCSVVLPPYDDMQRITDFLDTQCAKIDEIIAEAKASIEDYKQWKASIIYEAVTKGLDPNAEMKDSGIEWIGEIPKGWNIAKAGMLFKEFIRPYCKGDKPLSLSQQDGLVPTDEMKESSLKTASYDNWKRVYLDDLVLNRFKAHLGVFFASRYVGCVSFHYGVYHAIRSDVVPKYYEYLFHSPHYKSLFAQLSNGITVGLQNLSNRNFYSAYVHFPDYETQVEIVDFLEKKCSELESLIVEKRLLIDDLEAYKKSLIYEVVTGKRRVC